MVSRVMLRNRETRDRTRVKGRQKAIRRRRDWEKIFERSTIKALYLIFEDIKW